MAGVQGTGLKAAVQGVAKGYKDEDLAQKRQAWNELSNANLTIYKNFDKKTPATPGDDFTLARGEKGEIKVVAKTTGLSVETIDHDKPVKATFEDFKGGKIFASNRHDDLIFNHCEKVEAHGIPNKKSQPVAAFMDGLLNNNLKNDKNPNEDSFTIIDTKESEFHLSGTANYFGNSRGNEIITPEFHPIKGNARHDGLNDLYIK